eukprot:766819-Hanusia_phi.AAC.2
MSYILERARANTIATAMHKPSPAIAHGHTRCAERIVGLSFRLRASPPQISRFQEREGWRRDSRRHVHALQGQQVSARGDGGRGDERMC